MSIFISNHPMIAALFFMAVTALLASVLSFWASMKAVKSLAPHMRYWLVLGLTFIWNAALFFTFALTFWILVMAIVPALNLTESALYFVSEFLAYYILQTLFAVFVVESIFVVLRAHKIKDQPKLSWLRTIWNCLWPAGLVILTMFILGILGTMRSLDFEGKSTSTLEGIAIRKITLSDVMGTNLPPQPYGPENEATVAGIDKNGNGVRDDVELAIFAKYPNDAKVRAAELQYAMTEQMFLTEVFNTETWKAVAEQDGRANYCISETSPRPSVSDAKAWKIWNYLIDTRTKEVENWVFNTQARKDAEEKAYNYITSNGSKPGNECDIDLNTL